MSKADAPKYKATGTLRIIDKDGNVKQEMKITEFRPQPNQEGPKETQKDED